MTSAAPPPTEIPKFTHVHSKSIYHGLPHFPASIKGLSAIVTGANGISGDHLMRVLDESPERWSNIYALSRRPPAATRKWKTKVKHVAMDFLHSSPDELAKQLRDGGVKADYVFFFSYVQPAPKEGKGLWSDTEEMVRVNVMLLSNFLEALKRAEIKPKRFMLQTGAKNYGVHLGPIVTPQHEADPRVLLENNFYYAQEDLLFEYCRRNGVGWNVTMPSTIVGAVKDAAMNVVFPLGVFASVHAYLQQPMVYPGDWAAFQNIHDVSSAMMNGYLEEWMVLHPDAANQSFNAADGSHFTWGKFWMTLAKWYGVPYEIPESRELHVKETPYKPPPRGFGPPGHMRYTYTLTQWAKDQKNKAAWDKIVKQYGLEQSPFVDDTTIERVFSFADGAVLQSWPMALSMDKARKMGFFGFVDSVESIRAVLEEFVSLKMLPPLPRRKEDGD